MPLHLPRYVPPDQNAASKIVTPSRPFSNPERNLRDQRLADDPPSPLGRFIAKHVNIVGNAALGLVFGLPDKHDDDDFPAPTDRYSG